MEWTNAAVTVGAVILGWLLGEAGHLLKGRRDQREATGRALLEFLSLWHELRVIDLLRRTLVKRLDLSDEEECQVIRNVALTRNSFEDFGVRMESVVHSLAAFDPFLAAELRLRGSAADLIGEFKDLNGFRIPLDSRKGIIQSLQLGKRAVEKLLFYLAWRHGARTLLRLIMIFFRQIPKDPEFWQALEEIEEAYTSGSLRLHDEFPGT